MQDTIIQNPPDKWVRCLREGNKIFLVKENGYAFVSSPYTPREYGGNFAGKLFLQKGNMRHIDYWFMDDNGKGMDGKPLILPIEGYFVNEPVEIGTQEYQALRTEITELKDRMRKMETFIDFYIGMIS